MHHREEPLVNFEVGPQSQEFEFLVDTGTERSSLKVLPAEVNVGTRHCEVMGAEGRPFKAPIVENVEIEGNYRQCVVDLIYLPHLENNLLGRDLQIQLGVGIILKNGRMVVQIMTLTSADIEEVSPRYGHRKENMATWIFHQ